MPKTYGTIENYFLEVKQAVVKIQAFILNSQKTYESRTTTEGIIAGKLVFIDKSELHIQEYLSIDNRRIVRLAYRFHWQNEEKQLLVRWDYFPHHPHIKTHQHHKHTQTGVQESEEMTIIKLTQEIIKEIEIKEL